MARHISQQEPRNPEELERLLWNGIESWKEEINVLLSIQGALRKWVGKRVTSRLESQVNEILSQNHTQYSVSFLRRDNYTGGNSAELEVRKKPKDDATYGERVMNIGLVENTRLALMSSDVSAINGKIKAMEDWIKCAKAQAPLIAGQCKRWNEGLRLMQEVYEDTKDSSYTFYLE